MTSPATYRPWLATVALICCMATGVGAPTAHAAPGKSGPHVDALGARADADGHVRVIVHLNTDSALVAADARGRSLTKRERIAKAARGILDRVHPHARRGVTRFKHLPFLAMDVTPAGLDQVLASPESLTVYADRLARPLLADSAPLVGSDAAFNAGFSGSGQAVAVLDTGVDRTHPFLSPRLVSEACYSSTVSSLGATTVCPNGTAQQTGVGASAPCSVDGCDHGTHVAGIAAGNDASSTGVARDASIIGVQVFSRFDSSSTCAPSPAPCVLSFTSDQIRGLERVYELRNDFNIAAVNMSLGGGEFTTICDSEPAKVAIDLLRGAGIATIVASGNDGFTNAISAPACISSAISVGSTSKSDAVSGFSNSATLVDLLAPGGAIRSSVPGGGFATFNGTSMATPHVAGAFAVLKSSQPTAGVDALLGALSATGQSVTDTRNGLVRPRIDVAAALSAIDTGAASVLAVSPATAFVTSGESGGPFAPPSTSYSVANTSQEVVDWAVTTTAAWLTITPASGTLQPGSAANVIVAIDVAAAPVNSGAYSTTIAFEDADGATGKTLRSVSLTVQGPGIANDKFSDAVLLTTGAGTIAGTNVGATREPGEPFHANVQGGASVWWRWVAPTAGTLTVDTFGSTFDTVLAAYRGTSISTLIPVAANDDATANVVFQSEVQFDVQSGVVYYLAVDGYSDPQFPVSTGNVSLSWEFMESGNGVGPLAVTPEGGLTATGDVGGPFTPPGKSYTLVNTGTAPLPLSIATNGAFFDASAGVAQLAPGASTTLSVTLNASANALGPGTTVGSVVVNGISRTVSVSATPIGGLNDDFAESSKLPSDLPLVIGATNEGATLESGEPVHAGVPGGASVWWSWTAPTSGTAVITTIGSTFDTLLAVYRGSALNALTQVAANDDHTLLQSLVAFDVTAGESYRIAVDGYNAATGRITLNADVLGPIAGDAFADRVPVTQTVSTNSSVTATKEPGEPDHAGDPGGHSVWWTWTAPVGGPVTIDTLGSTFDTLLAVYTGNVVSSLTVVAENDDVDLDGGVRQSRVSFDAVAGRAYQIAVDGWGGDSGNVTLNVAAGGLADTLLSAVLPSSRSVQVGAAATAFATMINASGAAATNCLIEPSTSLPAGFNYYTTNAATNVVVDNSMNVPVDIPNGAAHAFLIELTPTGPFPAVDARFSYRCDNAGPAPVVSGLNTLLLAASNTPSTDIIALALAANGGTVVAAPGAPGAFALATINVGATEVTTVAPSPSDPALPVTLSICQTDAQAQCITQVASSVTLTVAQNETPTFSVFVQTDNPVVFAPAENRVRVVFSDPAGNVTGSTSVAVSSTAP